MKGRSLVGSMFLVTIMTCVQLVGALCTYLFTHYFLLMTTLRSTIRVFRNAVRYQ